ncbi:MAG: hypothetical protein AAF502_03530 [Bacteroidota bacterium]
MKASLLFHQFDRWNILNMRKYGYGMLRYSMAIIFIWFGILKPLGISPAQDLVINTTYWFAGEWFVPVLGWWEVAIGILLLFKPTIRFALLLLFLQMPGTFLPLVLLPEVTFTEFPYGLTMEGQYIVKNLTLIAAAIAIGGTISVANEERVDG